MGRQALLNRLLIHIGGYNDANQIKLIQKWPIAKAILEDFSGTI